MTDQTSTTTRRSVLRSAAGTAAAAGVALGATGSAGASSFENGDCVRFVARAQLWEQACPDLQNRLEVVDEGETASVSFTCTSDDHEFAFVSLDSAALTLGYANVNALEHC